MMDCLTFGRLLFADPESGESAVLERISECEHCRTFRRELRRFGLNRISSLSAINILLLSLSANALMCLSQPIPTPILHPR